MTSVASASIAPAAPAQTAQADVAPVAELAAPIAENPNPAWLAATPRVQPDFYNAATKPYVTPEMGLQLIQAIAGNTDYMPMTPARDTIGRYIHQALAAQVMTEKPATLDNLY